ncbi:putative RNA polymerase ECF-type sigma factor [Caenibius tardaugens NBRC 16725]|uniref:Putative RNA polymerase ECF-type sigma factor n=1 Tax=Caenibius tardaugens NBRC 16725 TaxID=1219035 RepID=U2ZVF4_9SPHN|nr:sigma-70 family RNA polymerase sigma factor [Caenibius tardaugens]AZI36669.1 sigma-70 family RNA polymerase sigma factor [Caenibius tardaugens NBRC 16725]GAD49329.1 putative RNA polymerase ECF-type sigma factor [Caenibius tardaugens NBRC 16725]
MSKWNWFKARSVEQLPAMRRYARSLVGDERADDLVHEALLRAYERHGTFRHTGNIQHWLFAIMHNCFVNGWRRAQVERAGVDSLSMTAAAHALPNQEHAVELDRLAHAFDGLPPEQREVLHLVVVEGLSYQAAASVLEIPVGTVMSRLSRARAHLRLGGGEQRPNLKLVRGQDGRSD